MNDEAAMLARRVAVDASAWMAHPGDPQVYARLVAAVAVWDAYTAPHLDAAGGEEELLDELADQHPPAPLGEGIPGLEAELRARARREL